MVKEDHIEMENIAMKQMVLIMKKMMPDMNVAEDEMTEIATENVRIIADTTTIDITDQKNMNVIIGMKEVNKIFQKNIYIPINI